MDEYPKTLSEPDWLFSCRENENFPVENCQETRQETTGKLGEKRQRNSSVGRPRGHRENKDWCRAYRQRKKQQRSLRTPPVRLPGIPVSPTLHCGAFQDYETAYAGKIDVIITDPPYGREYLPLYRDLAQFALTVLVPGGWLLCLTGYGIDYDVRTTFNTSGLEYLTVCTYLIPGATLKGRKHLKRGDANGISKPSRCSGMRNRARNSIVGGRAPLI